MFLLIHILIVFSTPGDQEKHAIVQWFSRIGEIPLGQRMSLGRERYSQEIFLNDNAELDSDIIVTSIVKKVGVRI